jgi:Secretion system C-terminal sorting domain/Domain of unknown function DUF11
VIVKNNSATAFSNVTITSPFPSSTGTGGTATFSAGYWSEFCTGNVHCYKWTLPTFAANRTDSLDIPLFINGVTTPITVTAQMTGSTPTDLTTANNQASAIMYPVGTPIPLVSLPTNPQGIPIVIERIYPNPTDSDLNLEVNSLIEGNHIFEIHNTLGLLINKQSVTLTKGKNIITLNVSDLSSGLYFIAPSTAQGKNIPIKFIKM